MAERVYLDTARVGRVSPTALAIQSDYLRFAALSGCPEALLDLLVYGGRVWPGPLQRKYPTLASWRGVDGLKERLRKILGVDKDLSLMLASRSHVLMKLASHLLLRTSQTVLIADVGWPRYHEILRCEAARLGRNVVEVPLREMIRSGEGATAVVDASVAAVRATGATALFLPAISHDGIQLPIRRIAQAIAQAGALRFFAVDGAQHTAHGRISPAIMGCDFYLGGAHKWLRGLYPMGIGVYGQPSSKTFIDTTVEELQAGGALDDPLFRLTQQLEHDALDGLTETVNLSALLSSHGAASDAYSFDRRCEILHIQLQNAEAIGELASRSGWRPVQPRARLRSGILLLEPRYRISGDVHQVRETMERRGVVASAYESGNLRLSMPRRKLDTKSLVTVGRALASVATVKRWRPVREFSPMTTG